VNWTEALRRLIAAEGGNEHLLCLVEAIEARPLTQEKLGKLIKHVGEQGWSAAIQAAIVVAYAEELVRSKRGRRTVTRETVEFVETGYPVGPRERWGYEGPITPRLSEREWWPLRNAVVSEADSTCHYCGDQGETMCADHVVPLSRGGTNERDNLVCCCIPCNSSKADRLLSEWKGRYR
jgi:hypothetical protein